MPQAIGAIFVNFLIAVGVPAAIAGKVALSPSGATPSGGDAADGLFLQHVWPHNVATRVELIARLSGRPDYSTALNAQMRGMVRMLERLAYKHVEKDAAIQQFLGMQRDRSPRSTISPAMAPLRRELEADDPGRFDALLAENHWPHMALGLCMDPDISEGSLLFSNSKLGIQKGDLVAYAARGLPMMGAKVYLGDTGGKVFFWCNKPAAVYAFDYDQLIHVSRVSWIKQPGRPLADARDFDFRPMLSPAGRMVWDKTDNAPFIAPKERTIIDGLGKALSGIWDEIQALPNPRRSWFSILMNGKGVQW